MSRLERDGLIAAGAEIEDGRGKKTYEITDKGRKELENWLAQPVEKVRSLRDEFLVKLIVRHLAGYGDTLANYRAAETSLFAAIT